MANENPSRTNIDLNFSPGHTSSAGLSDLRWGAYRRNRKTCENCEVQKNNLVQQSSFFDCSICLDSAKDPVVTCCGHLFCWPCIYRWLNHQSSANQCPVCKGEVTVSNVTPIYGQVGNNNNNTNNNNNNTKVDNSGSTNIPLRPQARRIDMNIPLRIDMNIPLRPQARRIDIATRDSAIDWIGFGEGFEYSTHELSYGSNSVSPFNYWDLPLDDFIYSRTIDGSGSDSDSGIDIFSDGG
ncbi:hypothetical protein ABFS82_10G172900 [Erythranthe guttata]